MKYDALKALVNAKVYENTEQEITGEGLNEVLQSAIASLGAHYQMGGLVSPNDHITVGDEPVVFIATTPGTYTYFGSQVVADGEVALLVWSGTAWSKRTTDISTRTELSQLGQEVDTLNVDVFGGSKSVNIGQPTTGGYYNTNGLLASHESTLYYSPIDVSAYLGKHIKISIVWQPGAVIADWLYLCMFRDNANVSEYPNRLSGKTLESSLYALATNNEYELEIEVTDNYLLLAKRDATTTISVSAQIDGAIPSINVELGEKIDKTLVQGYKSINIFDPSTGTVNGQYVSGCKAAIDGDETYVTLSSAGSQMQEPYVSNVKFIFADGTSQNAGTPTNHYSSEYSRRGLIYEVPAGAKYFMFDYRATYSGGVLLYDVMVTKGNIVPNLYIPYKITYQFQSPDFSMLYREVFVATNGNDDTGDGTEGNPFASIQRAIKEGNEVIVKDGAYNIIGQINLNYSPKQEIRIRADKNARPILFGGTKILEEDGELVSGYTKVYSAQISNPFSFARHWIFQYNVPDANTEITTQERTPYHGRRRYRCDFTAITKVDSVAAIESSIGFAYYYDSDNSTLYYSRPEAVSSSKFLFIASNTGYLFSGVGGHTLLISGITTYGVIFNVTDTANSKVINCQCFAALNGAGFKLDRSINLLLDNCEAARVEYGASAATGDGFNVHTDQDAPVWAKRCSFELRNCWSHDNWNDGYSDHEGCEGFINGGLYEHNCIGGIGAGITPAYGAHDVIKDAITQGNSQHGLAYVGDGTSAGYESGAYGTVQVVSVISRGNLGSGFVFTTSNQIGDFVNCIAYNNTGTGFLASNGTMRCINTKSINNGTNYDGVVSIGAE